MSSTSIAVAASSWAMLMALAPVLQIRRITQRRSSQDVSLGFQIVMVPGWALWVAHAVAPSDIALAIPNALSLVIGLVAITFTLRFRHPEDMSGRRLRQRGEPKAADDQL